MKKYAFYGICTLVVFVLVSIALIMNPKHNVGATPAADIMLFIAGAVMAIMILAIFISAIVKAILTKLKNEDSKKPKGKTRSKSLVLLTTSMKYDEKYDFAEHNRKNRIEKQMKE